MGTWLLLAANAAAQVVAAPEPCETLDPPCEDTPPIVSFTPSSGTFMRASQFVTITWGDDTGLRRDSVEIKLNNVGVSDSFNYTARNRFSATSQGRVTLRAGVNTLTARICDTATPSQCTTRSANYKYEPPPPPEPYTKPVVSLAPMSPALRRVDLCAADCFEAVVTHTTPAYVSLDTERAVTLVYRSGQSRERRVLVEVNASDNASANVPQKMSIRVRRPGGHWVKFTDGSTEIFYKSGKGTTRLAAQFSPGDRPTGSYQSEVIVRTWWNDGHMEEQDPVPFRFIVVNEQASKFGAGWSMVGLQRLHSQYGGALITEGDGSAVFFKKTGPNAWTAPAGEFSRLTFNKNSSLYTRKYPDGSRVVFNTEGTLRFIKDRFGNQSDYLWSPSGRIYKIKDPIDKEIKLAYTRNGKLTTITDPAGRQTRFIIENGNLKQITDPDGVRAFAFSYESGRMKSYTDRRGSVWTFA